MMNNEITPFEALREYGQKRFKREIYDPKEILEILAYIAPVIYEERTTPHRWWNDVFRVVKIDDDLYVGYEWGEVTGDTSLEDIGWEFDWKSLCFAEPIQVTKTIYKKKEG